MPENLINDNNVYKMATAITQHLFIKQQGEKPDIEMYFNNAGEIFVSDTEQTEFFWFTFNKEDWDAIKKFVDEQFEE